MITLAPVSITAAAFQQQLPIRDPSLYSAVVLQNESAYNLVVTIGSNQKTIAAWTADVVQLDGVNTRLQIAPTLYLPGGPQPNNNLTTQLYSHDEAQPNPSQFPMPLARNLQNYNLGSYLGLYTGGTQNFTIPPGTQSIAIIANNVLQTGTVVGHQSGLKYANAVTIPSPGTALFVEVPQGADTSVDVSATSMGASAIGVFASPQPVSNQTQIQGTVVVAGDALGDPVPVTQPSQVSGITTATWDGNVVNNGTLTAVAAVGGKTITVYGYEASFDPNTIADTGFYLGIIKGGTSGKVVAETQLNWASNASNASARQGPIWYPGGIGMTIGEALVVLGATSTAGKIDLIGCVWYTQT